MKIQEFISDQFTVDVIASTLCRVRNSKDRSVVGNIELAERIVLELQRHAAELEGKVTYAFKVFDCSFVSRDHTFVENEQLRKQVGVFISDRMDGYLSSGFWLKDRLIPKLGYLSPKEPFKHTIISDLPESVAGKLDASKTYRCISPVALIFKLNADGIKMREEKGHSFFLCETTGCLLDIADGDVVKLRTC